MTNSANSTSTISSLHGNFVVINDTGVVITGEAGCGKSETTLQLLDRGHQFVADDLLEIATYNNELWGYQPSSQNGWLYIHNIGFCHCDTINPTKKSWLPNYRIDFLVELKSQYCAETKINPWIDKKINNHIVKQATIHHCLQRNISLLIETLVKGFIDTKIAYNA